MTQTTTEITFTQREAEVVEKLVEGKSSNRIARELGIASGTVRSLVSRAASKLPGGGTASFRITRWYFLVCDGSTGALLIRENGDGRPT